MKRKGGKRLRTVILVCILVAALGVTAALGYYYNRLRMIDRHEGYIYGEHSEVEEDIDIGVEVGYDNVDASSLDEFLISWATNDIQKLSNKNVLNILLCGVDSKNGKATGGRSDAIILVSVNKRAKKVTLVSFFRDSYTYIDLRGDPKNPRTMMDKVNSAYSLGGPATLIDTLEANYKIIIDGYVSVDFKSFPKLINALGGVTLNVTKSEASYVNRTAPSMKRSFPAGDNVKLNGAQALVYSRIRHLGGGDIDRTARQRKVILGILQSARAASNGQVLNAANQVLDGGYLMTNFSNLQITNLIYEAFAGNWMDYEVVQYHTPTVESADATGIPTQSIKGNTWFWVVDYPRAAEELQLLLYDTTSIALTVEGEERSDYLANLFKEASGSRGGSSSGGNGSGGYHTTTRPSGDGWTEDETATYESTEPLEESTAEETEGGFTWPWWIPTRAQESTQGEPQTTEEETATSASTTRAQSHEAPSTTAKPASTG